jgi:thiazole synthase
MMAEDVLKFGNYTLNSRLITGTGKFDSLEVMREALTVSGSEMVTVAVRRAEIGQKHAEHILDYIPKHMTILPNTAGCFSATDAVRSARLSREALETDLVKLEVLGDKQTLLPDPVETLKAAETLMKEGFAVLAYTSDDPIMAQRLADLGVAAVMPAGAPIGSGQGILNYNSMRIILEQKKADIPIIVDAGVGTASDVTVAMELGCDGVLLNTGIALADDPVMMAKAMKQGIEAGRLAYLAGRIPRKRYAKASSPETGTIAPAGGA